MSDSNTETTENPMETAQRAQPRATRSAVARTENRGLAANATKNNSQFQNGL
jgi:hypothetical protein